MAYHSRKKAFAFFLALSSLSAFQFCWPSHTDARAPESLDARLTSRLKQISKLGEQEDDKLGSVNLDLLKFLKSACLSSISMEDPLNNAIKAGLMAFTSTDKKVRCYSWDTLTGGTMHVFYSLIAYDAGNDQFKCLVLNPATPESEGDPGSCFEALDTIKTTDGKTVYLTQDLFIGSGMIHGRTIKAYVITNGKLTKYPFFQAGTKNLDSISFDFDEYGDATQFELSKDQKTLKIPIIKPAGKDAPGSGHATGKYLTYLFNGTKFVFTKGK